MEETTKSTQRDVLLIVSRKKSTYNYIKIKVVILNKFKTFFFKAAIPFDSLVWLGKLFHSFISSDPSPGNRLEIAMQLHKELVKSDFVRQMMFGEISKSLFITVDIVIV